MVDEINLEITNHSASLGLKVSNVSFWSFPEIAIIISSMVNQISLHANCFTGINLTFKIEIGVSLEITS